MTDRRTERSWTVDVDEHRVGLDHLSFACANRAELITWRERLDELGIAHGDIVDAHYGSGVSFRDPDGIASTSSTHDGADSEG